MSPVVHEHDVRQSGDSTRTREDNDIGAQVLAPHHRAPCLRAPDQGIVAGRQAKPHDTGEMRRRVAFQTAQQLRDLGRHGHQLGGAVATCEPRLFAFDGENPAVIRLDDTRAIIGKCARNGFVVRAANPSIQLRAKAGSNKPLVGVRTA